MKTALVGYTGFVGGNLNSQFEFTDHFNTKNIHQLHENEYDLVVCAATRAEMWKINQDPEPDRLAIEELKGHLKTTSIKELVLISSVAVYPVTKNVDENTTIDANSGTPYGKHRIALEQFAAETFNTHIVRLPGLFGDGLKKNIIFDFIHNNNVEKIHADAVYQFYNLAHLWEDIQKFREQNLELVNLVTEPTSVAEVARAAFGLDFKNRPEGMNPAYFDIHSVHAQSGNYFTDKATVLDEIRQFVETQ